MEKAPRPTPESRPKSPPRKRRRKNPPQDGFGMFADIPFGSEEHAAEKLLEIEREERGWW